MILIPAIDLKGGKVVRLYQGKFSDVTEYPEDPLAAAKKWESLGAKWLHVVDLDGAQTGVMKNQGIIAEIVREVNIPVQVGGGIRGEAIVEYLLTVANVARVVVGTKAIEQRDFITNILKQWQERIVVSLDCENGFVTGRGWVEKTNIKAVDLAKELMPLGLKWLVYTDIARDGTLAGPNYEQLQHLIDQVPNMNVIASGGISSVEDVKRLASMPMVKAAITGKALYEGKLDFKQALDVC